MCDNFGHMQPQKLAQKMKPACRGDTSNYALTHDCSIRVVDCFISVF